MQEVVVVVVVVVVVSVVSCLHHSRLPLDVFSSFVRCRHHPSSTIDNNLASTQTPLISDDADYTISRLIVV